MMSLYPRTTPIFARNHATQPKLSICIMLPLPCSATEHRNRPSMKCARLKENKAHDETIQTHDASWRRVENEALQKREQTFRGTKWINIPSACSRATRNAASHSVYCRVVCPAYGCSGITLTISGPRVCWSGIGDWPPVGRGRWRNDFGHQKEGFAWASVACRVSILCWVKLLKRLWSPPY